MLQRIEISPNELLGGKSLTVSSDPSCPIPTSSCTKEKKGSDHTNVFKHDATYPMHATQKLKFWNHQDSDKVVDPIVK
jgi:hypothetical protein